MRDKVRSTTTDQAVRQSTAQPVRTTIQSPTAARVEHPMRSTRSTTIAEKIQRAGHRVRSTTAGKTYTETNDRMLDAIVDTNRKAVDFAVKTFDQINDRIADQTPTIGLPFEVPKMVDRVRRARPQPTLASGTSTLHRAPGRDESRRQRAQSVSMLPRRQAGRQARWPATKTATKTAAAKKPDRQEGSDDQEGSGPQGCL